MNNTEKMQNISVVQLDVMLGLQTDKGTPGFGSNYPNQVNFKSHHAESVPNFPVFSLLLHNCLPISNSISRLKAVTITSEMND